jgi:hypothetical protein
VQPGGIDVSQVHTERGRDRAGVGRTEPFQPTAHDLAHRLIARPLLRVAGRDGDVGIERRTRENSLQHRNALGSHDQLSDACDATLRSQLMDERRPR